MSIELTQQQQYALDAQHEKPLCVLDPRSNETYYLVAAPEYEAVRALLDDERRQKAIRAVGLRNAMGRMEEGT